MYRRLNLSVTMVPVLGNKWSKLANQIVCSTNEHYFLCVLTAGAETVITADQAVRGGKVIELKQVVDAAVVKCPSIKRVFVGMRTGAKVNMGPKDISLDQVSEK